MPRSPRQETRTTQHSLLSAFGHHPYTLPMVMGAGFSREQLRSALRHGYVTRVGRGLYVNSPSAALGIPTSVSRAIVATAPLKVSSAVICGRLAGELHSLPFVTPRGRPDEIAVSEIMILDSANHRCGHRAPDAVVRRVQHLPPDTTEIHGVTVTSLLHTAIDMVRMGTRHASSSRARALPLPEALVVLDAATAQLGATTPEEAAALVKSLRPRFRYGPGIRSVDAALEFLDPLAETPLESWSRGYMIVYGVPKPLTQHVIVGANGIDYRTDFCWPDLMVIGEADGLEKYGSSPEEFRRAKSQELERQRALEAAGWIVVRWTWDELARDPQAVMWRILDAMQHARRRLRAS